MAKTPSATLAVLAAFLLASTGCGDDFHDNVNLQSFSFCGRVTDGDEPVRNSHVKFHAQVLHKIFKSYVIYEGETYLNHEGVGCVTLKGEAKHSLLMKPEHARETLELTTLQAHLGREIVSGVVTRVDPQKPAFYVEAAFDLEQPDPGPPGQLGALELLRRSLGGKERLASGTRPSEEDRVPRQREVPIEVHRSDRPAEAAI